MKITKFNKANLREVREVINAALTDALSELGLTADIGNIKYGEADFNCKLTVSCGSDADAAQREWDKYAPMLGLTSEDFGKTFSQDGKLFTVVGIKPKSPKFPIIAMDASGTRYKFTKAVMLK